MKLRQLRALIAIADKRSIHEAARQLCISQPALSKTIQELESSMDALLVERSSTGTTLTPYGERLVCHARLIMESVVQAHADIQAMKGISGGEITVGATPLAGALSLTASALDTFRRAYPNVRLRILEMRSAQLVEQLRQGSIDFAVVTEWVASDPAYEATPLCRRASVIAARQGHPRLKAGSIHALQDAEWISCDPVEDASSSFNRLFSENGATRPLRVTECASVFLALGLCARSDALMVLSSESLAGPVVTQGIDFIEIEERLPEQSIFLVKHRRQVLSGPAERLVAGILSYFHSGTRQSAGP